MINALYSFMMAAIALCQRLESLWITRFDASKQPNLWTCCQLL